MRLLVVKSTRSPFIQVRRLALEAGEKLIRDFVFSKGFFVSYIYKLAVDAF
jgi:hypothetical protein